MANIFLTKMMCSVASRFMCSRNMKDDLEELAIIKNELTLLKEGVLQRLTGVDGPIMMSPWHVNVWLSDVEVKLAEVNKLVNYGVEGYWSRICFCTRVEKILSELIALKCREPFSETMIVGLENKLEDVWKYLTVDEVGVIGIWGMGGIGKTTLLTQLNSKCLSHFDFVVWLHVSQEVKLEDLQDEFVKQLGLSKEKKSNDDKAALISQVLQNKKVLVLLDDLWNRVELKDIGIPLNNKCQVVFTTRSKVVCRLMEVQRSIKVEPLGWEEAWRLFRERVGIETFSADPRISRRAKRIVRECKGLPLALVSSAHAMSSKKTLQEWKHSVEILRKSASTHVFSNLKLSYDRLPHQNIKSCLLYCALFPENFDIPKQELIYKWNCEGFLDDVDDKADPINKGYDIVKTLVDLCFLEDKVKNVRMHDVIRDMCLWIACEVEKEKENYFVQADTQLPMGEWRDARRISLMWTRTSLVQGPTEAPASAYLLTLLLSCNYEMDSIPDGFFRHMKSLTVLDLSGTGLRVLPTEISELVSLQYLDISYTKIEMLPQGIMNLEKLQYFILEHTIKLREIPRRMIANFKALQAFRIVGSYFNLSKFNVEELESLECLKDLSITVSDADVYHKLLNNHKLSSCIQLLLVKDLEPPYGEFLGTTPQSIYGICKTSCFDSLRVVEVYCCHYLQDLTWVMRTPNLTTLSVKYCENLEVISQEGMEEDLNPFARLQTLILTKLPQLKSICGEQLLFPLLDKIEVCGCPMLKKLPLNTSSAKGRQLVIQGTTDWWSKLQWEDDATRTAFKFCFREIVCFCSRDETSTSAVQDRRIERRVCYLQETIDRWPKNKTMIQYHLIEHDIEHLLENPEPSPETWPENRTMIEEFLWKFNNYIALNDENGDVEVQEEKVAANDEAIVIKGGAQ